MSRCWLTGLTILGILSGVACVQGASSFALLSSGEIATTPQSNSVALEMTTGVIASTSGSSFACEAEFRDASCEGLSISGVLARRDIELSGAIHVDGWGPSAITADASLRAPIGSGALEARTVLQSGAFGVGLEASLPDPCTLESIRLGLNLGRYGAVQTASCSLPFSFLEVDFGFSLPPCMGDAGGSLLFDSSGFAELYVTLTELAPISSGIGFGASLLLQQEGRSLDVLPSVMVESPTCFDVYVGLNWNDATSTLSGLQFLGFGVRCELGSVRLRGLWSLDPTQIALLPPPHWALLGLVWDIAAPHGLTAEGSVAAFFGSDQLFDLEEVRAELVFPLSTSSTLFVRAVLRTSGTYTLTLGWDLTL